MNELCDRYKPGQLYEVTYDARAGGQVHDVYCYHGNGKWTSNGYHANPRRVIREFQGERPKPQSCSHPRKYRHSPFGHTEKCNLCGASGLDPRADYGGGTTTTDLNQRIFNLCMDNRANPFARRILMEFEA